MIEAIILGLIGMFFSGIGLLLATIGEGDVQDS